MAEVVVADDINRSDESELLDDDSHNVDDEDTLNVKNKYRPTSPELNCAICLEEFKNISFTDTCLHQFCYLCLKEWSKVKPECPLCKQTFRTIIHNVRTIDDYDEDHIDERDAPVDLDPTPTVLINLAFQRSLYPYRNALEFRSRIENGMYRATVSHYERDAPLLYIREIDSRPLLRPLPPPPPPLGSARPRREIYRHDRWVIQDTSGRLRQSSPTFYRENPAQTHRLVPWLLRELNVLLDVSMDTQTVCTDILSLIVTYPIQSREFKEAVRPYIGDRVDHFIYEFYNFAISPHDMLTYDVLAQYGPRAPEGPWRLSQSLPETASSSSSDEEADSDIELIDVVQAKPTHASNSENYCQLPMAVAGPSGLNYPTGMSETVIEIDSTTTEESSDEIEIIGTITPASPETITIPSSTDCDTDEVENEDVNKPSCSYISQKRVTSKKEKPPPRCLSSSSTSSSSSSSSSCSSSSSTCNSSTESSSTSSTSSSDEDVDYDNEHKKRSRRKRRKRRSSKRLPRRKRRCVMKRKIIRYTSEEEEQEEEKPKEATVKEEMNDDVKCERSSPPPPPPPSEEEVDDEDMEVDVEGDDEEEDETYTDGRRRLRSVVVQLYPNQSSRWLRSFVNKQYETNEQPRRVVDYSDHSDSE